MRVHVLPGDSLTGEFKKTDIDGEIIVCRECLVVGPVDADNPDEFWDQRAHFILAEYAEDEIAFHERVADELEQLRDIEAGTEVNLWFEYELFCSVNMWFCMSLLHDTGADMYRVEPIELNSEDRWKGFGQLDASQLQKCFDSRKRMSKEDVELGSSLWNAFRNEDDGKLKELAASRSDVFPYLEEVVDAAIQKSTQPSKLLTAIQREGIKDFDEIFAEFSTRAGVYGFGDLQVQRLLDHLP